MRLRAALVILSLIFMGWGCSTYEPKVQPLKLPEAYANVQRVEGTYVAARAWSNEEEAREAFGFNIIGAGLIPVQVNFDNRGTQTLVIEPSQTFLLNQKEELFPVLADKEAYDRVSRSAMLSEGVKGLAQGTLLGGATGALIGAAVGVVAGRGVGEYAMRGAAMGASAGGVLGATTGATDTQVPRTIANDLSRRSLKNTPIKPGNLAYGIILFPQEAGQPRALRLQLKDKETGQVHTLVLPL
jgi:hypothetical protein